MYFRCEVRTWLKLLEDGGETLKRIGENNNARISCGQRVPGLEDVPTTVRLFGNAWIEIVGQEGAVKEARQAIEEFLGKI